MVLTAAEIFSGLKLCFWPQYRQAILMMRAGLDDASAGAFLSAIDCPQTLHLAVLTPDGSLALLIT
jgi:hypothetical protein